MAGASIETTLELWASSLRDMKGRMRPLVRSGAGGGIGGTVSGRAFGERAAQDRLDARGSGGRSWPVASAGDPGPRAVGRGCVARHRARLRAGNAGDEDAVLVIDETGFLKQGKASCGVARQYTGSAGKITNCQIGVFASYVSRHGHAFIDRALYLPKEWTDDRARLKAAHVPETVGFATKPQIARRMIARAIAAKVPFCFVAADSVYGTGDIETVAAQGGQRLCPGRRLQPRVPLLGQEAAYWRHRREDRAESSQKRLAAPVGGRRNQRPAPA